MLLQCKIVVVLTSSASPFRDLPASCDPAPPVAPARYAHCFPRRWWAGFVTLCSVVIVMVMVTLSGTAVVRATDLDDPARFARIFGRPTSGRALVTGLKNACGHVAQVFASADPRERTLLFSDRSMTKFHHSTCNGPCDIVQTSNAVVACRQTRLIEGCVIYGAIFEGDVFQFSIDPNGTDLAKVCALPR
jgi:hypothetical protein